MKLNYKRTFLIGLAFLSISAFWQMYDSIIPLMLQNTFHLGETVTGMLMAMDNVLAIFLLPLFGALSDRADTGIGKRMPFIVGGTALAVLFLLFLNVADRRQNLAFFIVTLFLLLLSMGLYRSPAVALMPDLTPNRLRSKANAVINLMGAVGGVYALLMIKRLVGRGERPDYLPLFLSIGGLMVAAVAVLFVTVRENQAASLVAADERQFRQAGLEQVEGKRRGQAEAGAGRKEGGASGEEVGAGRKEGRASGAEVGADSGRALSKPVKRSMAFLLMSILLWFTAYNAVTTAFSRYTRVVWHMEGGSFADCLMVATVAAILSYIPIGNIASRVGRKKTILTGIVLMSLCYFAAIFAGAYHPAVNVAFAAIGIGWAAINVNSYPMIVEMAKGSDIGKFTGTYYTFSMAAQIITPVLSGFLLENVSYRTLFPYAFLFSTLAFFTMLQVRHGDSKPEKKKDILDNFDVED